MATKKPKTVIAKNANEAESKKFTGSKVQGKRKLVVVNTRDTFWSPAKKGDFVEGEFQEFERREGGKFGVTETVEKDGKKVKVKVSFCGVIADHSTGEIIKLPSTKVLNDFFEEMEKGTYVRVTFDGKKLKKDKKKGDDNSEYNDYILEKEETEPKPKKK